MPCLQRHDRDPGERSLALLIVLLALIMTHVPYFLGELRTPEGTFFIGHPYPLDTNGYFNQMLQGARHGVLFCRNHATTEPHRPAALFNFYLVVGWLAALGHVGFTAMFHVARLAFGFAALWAVYRALPSLFSEGYERIGALVLVCFSGGFDAVAEANTFRSIALFPHFAASILFFVVYFHEFERFFSGRGGGTALSACVAAVVATGIVHPWNFATMGVVSVAFYAVMAARQGIAFDRRRIAGGLALATAVGAVASAHVWTSRTNPVFGAIARQNVMLGRGLGEMVNSFGLLWLPAIAGAILAFRRWKRSPLVFPAVWAVGGVLLVVVPSPFQRRLYEGLHVPIALLAASAVFATVRAVAAKRGIAARPLVIGAVAATLLATIPYNSRFLRFPYLIGPPSPLYYPPAEMLRAATWVNANLPENVNVLASVATGQLLCHYTLVNSFVVHSVGTIDFVKKRDWTAWFYSGAGDAQQMRDACARWGLQYVFYGPWERISPRFDPTRYPWLKRRYEDGDILIFEVSLP